MKKVKILSLTIINFLIIGCAMDPELDPLQAQSGQLNFKQYAQILGDASADGTVLIQSNMSILNPDEPYNIDISERPSTGKHIKFYNEDNVPVHIVGSTDQEFNRTLYGTDLKYSIDGAAYKSLYIPKLINPVYTPSKIAAKTTITWNADPLNKNGVAIWFYYMPTIQYFSIMEANQHYIVEGIVVPDNGSYTISESLLSRLPQGAVIELNIGRAAYDISSSNPSVVAFTVKSLTAELRK